jgi:pimeloyl-ACP methyl ester carboxylesterase
MSTIREQTLELGGFGTRALVLSPDHQTRGDPLLLLHGWSDSADTWRPLLRRLERLRRSATALDMPGFGRADRLDREAEILPQLDRFVNAAIELEAERAGGRRVVVVGNSLGGCAAIRAAERPDLPIAGIVPIAPAGLDMAGWFGIVEGAPLVRLILRAPLPMPEVVVREAVGRAYAGLAYARPREVDPSVVRGFTRHVRTRRDVIRVLATGRRLLPEIRDPFRLERVRCPVLMVWGERDRMVYASGAERVLRAVAGSRLEVIEHCGHCPQVEAPERVVELLDEFGGAPAETGPP